MTILHLTSFNPRSRKGNDGSAPLAYPGYGVSIHVPARGTTVTYSLTFEGMGFQSTFPQGERLGTSTWSQIYSGVSIHVPARGTTRGETVSLLDGIRFQSTFPQGERLNLLLLISHSRQFQSTFPQGERPRLVFFLILYNFVSIHVPARGTTSRTDFLISSGTGFNPRSRKGNDSNHL